MNPYTPFFRERNHVNSSGFSEFCIRNIDRHAIGRREIELAEMDMPGILALREKAREDKPLKVGAENSPKKCDVYFLSFFF